MLLLAGQSARSSVKSATLNPEWVSIITLPLCH
jgi:hypothetical protein